LINQSSDNISQRYWSRAFVQQLFARLVRVSNNKETFNVGRSQTSYE